MGYERPIAHVGFLYLMTGLDAHQLRHQTVHDIGIIGGLVGFGIGQEAQVDELLVSHVIQAKEVGTGFLNGVAIGFQRIRVSTGQELSRTMAQTLVQVGMQVVTAVTIFFYQSQRLLVDDKLFLETGTMGCLVIGIGDIGDGDALGTVLRPDPVGIGQVDANSGRGVFVTAQHGGTDGIGRHTLDLRFAETGVYRGMVLEPLGIARDGLGAFGSLEVFIFHNTFPRAFQS